jgi:hypothetical protein
LNASRSASTCARRQQRLGRGRGRRTGPDLRDVLVQAVDELRVRDRRRTGERDCVVGPVLERDLRVRVRLAERGEDDVVDVLRVRSGSDSRESAGHALLLGRAPPACALDDVVHNHVREADERTLLLRAQRFLRRPRRGAEAAERDGLVPAREREAQWRADVRAQPVLRDARRAREAPVRGQVRDHKHGSFGLVDRVCTRRGQRDAWCGRGANTDEMASRRGNTASGTLEVTNRVKLSLLRRPAYTHQRDGGRHGEERQTEDDSFVRDDVMYKVDGLLQVGEERSIVV